MNITYEVKVNGAANSQTLATNTATLYADHTESDEKSTLYDVGESGGSGSSDPTIRLQKKETDSDKLLKDAQFTLYVEDTSGSSGSIEVQINGKTIKLYPVGTYTTDEYGEITKIGPSDGKRDCLYALVETKAPDGYILSAEPYFFYFPSADGEKWESVKYNEKDYPVNLPNANDTIVVENPPEAYTLPETGGAGKLLYTVAGLTLIAVAAVLASKKRMRRVW